MNTELRLLLLILMDDMDARECGIRSVKRLEIFVQHFYVDKSLDKLREQNETKLRNCWRNLKLKI